MTNRKAGALDILRLTYGNTAEGALDILRLIYSNLLRKERLVSVQRRLSHNCPIVVDSASVTSAVVTYVGEAVIGAGVREILYGRGIRIGQQLESSPTPTYGLDRKERPGRSDAGSTAWDTGEGL